MNLSLTAAIILGLSISVAGLPTSTRPGKAPVVTHKTPKLFEAKLLEKENTTLRGLFSIWTQGVGTKVHADLWGLPEQQALPYHIHALPVPEDGNCYGTGAHLDPYGRGENPPCDPSTPQTCEVGDLGGKHAPMFSAVDQPLETEYTDFFLSTDPADPAYFGNRSVVIHAPNNARINCGNFVHIVPDGGVHGAEE